MLENRIKPRLASTHHIARQRRAVEIYGCFKPFCRVYENSRIYCMSLKRHYISKSEPHNAKILSVFGLFPRLKSTSQTKGSIQWKIPRRIKKQYLRMAVDKKFGFAEYEYAKTQGKLTPEVKLEYLQRAADHGCGQAEYAIGKIFYERGQINDALYYFEKAGRRDSMARTYLGLLYCYSLDDWERGMMLLRSASDEGYAPAIEAIRAIEKNLDARIIVGVCDLFYYASNILDESGEDYYSHDHSDGVDIRIKKEDRAKRMGITISGF